MILIEEKLNSLGINLPKSPKPAGSYIPISKSNNLIFVSGQIPIDTESDQIKYHGKIGSEKTVLYGQNAAILCTLNALALIKENIGSLEEVKKIVKVSGFINCDNGFSEHPKVINPASELLVKIFGESGKHARVVVGVSSLPLNSSVEMEFIVEIGNLDNS